jgi:hypothetical protein
MNSKELTELIVHYITVSKLQNAILINGSWGSGKTYYVRNDLIRTIEEIKPNGNKRLVPVYISLYGVEHLSDISREMFNKTVRFGKDFEHEFRSGKFVGSKARKKYSWEVTKGSAKALVKGLLTKYLGIELNLPTIKDHFSYLDNTEIVLILDDLERSKIEIVELLGYINNFVEEYEIKTIIVGNEDEIKKMFSSESLVSKYELIKDLELPIEKETNGKHSPTSNNVKANNPNFRNGIIKTDRDTLDAQVKYLFPNPTNYETIKEKLIGFTINFTPDLTSVFTKLTDNKMSKKTIDDICRIFKQHHCSNIRTFLFALEMYNIIVRILDDITISNKEDVLKIITDSLFYLSIISKDQRLAQKTIFSDFNFSFEKSISDETDKLLTSEVNNFLNTSIIAEKRLKEIFMKIDKEISKNKMLTAQKQNDALKELQTHWIHLEDDDLKGRMSRAIQNVYNNPLDLNVDKKLISYVYFYNEIFDDAKYDVKKIVDEVVRSINSATDRVTDDGFFHSGVTFSDKTIIDEISHLFSQIEDAAKSHNETLLHKLGESVSTVRKNWIEDIKELLESGDRFRQVSKNERKSIIGYLSISTILCRIKDCSISELNDFFYEILQKVYSFGNIGEFYSNDLPAIEELNDGIMIIKKEKSATDGKKVFAFVLGQISDYLSKTIIPKLKSGK